MGCEDEFDLLDTVIALKHPVDYRPNDGLRCEVHFEKTRSMLGEAAMPFEVSLGSGPDGRAVWTCRNLEDAKTVQAAGLFAARMSVREVAQQLRISKTEAGRLRQRWSLGQSSEASPRPTA
jgi:putative DNA primase/helicase